MFYLSRSFLVFFAVYWPIFDELHAASNSSDIDRTVVKGDGLQFTEKDVAKEAEEKLQRAKIRGETEKKIHDIESTELDSLVETKLLRLEIERMGLIDEMMVKQEAKIAKFQKKHPTEEDRARFFAVTGTTEAKLYENYLNGVILERMEKEAGVTKPSSEPPASSSPRMIMPPRKSAKLETTLIRQIWIPRAEANATMNDQQRMALATEIATNWRSLKPEEWPASVEDTPEEKALCKKGQLPRQILREPLKAPAEKLTPGEVSEVIVSDKGFHVLRAITRDAFPGDQPVSTSKQKRYEEQTVKWNAYIATLKARYHVQYLSE